MLLIPILVSLLVATWTEASDSVDDRRVKAVIEKHLDHLYGSRLACSHELAELFEAAYNVRWDVPAQNFHHALSGRREIEVLRRLNRKGIDGIDALLLIINSLGLAIRSKRPKKLVASAALLRDIYILTQSAMDRLLSAQKDGMEMVKLKIADFLSCALPAGK
jgi:hypothetical protein